MRKQEDDEQEEELIKQLEFLQQQQQTKLEHKTQIQEENQILEEEYNMLKIKSTALNKELEEILHFENEDDEEKKKVVKDDSSSSEDEDKTVNHHEHKKKDQTQLNPLQFINEKSWEKIAQEKMKAQVNEKIAVLRQDFTNDTEFVDERDENDGKMKIVMRNPPDQIQGDGTQIRAYINYVLVKVVVTEVLNREGQKKAENQKGKKQRQEYLEQKFKVTKETTFQEIKNEACNFWGLKIRDFNLVLPSMHEIEQLTNDKHHMAYRVEKFFEINMSKRAVLHLIRPDIMRKEVLQEEKNAIKIKGAKKSTRFDKVDKRTPEERRKEIESSNKNKFFAKYPDLKEAYIEDITQFEKGKSKHQFENPDMSFCPFLISLSMFSLSIFAFYNYRSFSGEYFNTQNVVSILDQNPYNFQNYSSINNQQDLYLFMTETLAFQLFKDQRQNQSSPLYDPSIKIQYFFGSKIVPLGKLRFRQQRFSQIATTSTLPNNEQIIFLRPDNYTQINLYLISLTQSDQQQITLYDGSQSWHYWNTSDQLQTKSSFITDEYSYTGDGYVCDFSLGMSSQDFINQVNDLLNNGFFDQNTAVLFIDFNSYLSSQDRFVVSQMVIEFSITGTLITRPLKITSFPLDQIKQNSISTLYCDLFQIFFCCCYAYRIIFVKIPMKTKWKKDKKGNLDLHKITKEPIEEPIEGYNKYLSIFVDSMVILMFCLKFFLSQLTNYHDVDSLLNDNWQGAGTEQYVELVHFSDYYMQQYQMYTIIIILNVFNLLNALRVVRQIHWIILIFGRTMNVIINFMMMLLPIQIGFSFLSTCFIGPYLQKYCSLVNGIKMQIITMMGQQDSMSLMRNNYWFTIIWTMSFIIFFAYLFVTASVVAFEDGFDETVQEKGYPADFQQASVWTLTQYFLWALDWLPENFQKNYKLEERLKSMESFIRDQINDVFTFIGKSNNEKIAIIKKKFGLDKVEEVKKEDDQQKKTDTENQKQ